MNKALTQALVIQSRADGEGLPEGGRSHKVHLHSGNLPEVLRFAQDDTLLVLLSQRHPFQLRQNRLPFAR
jgi:hypothetical protein